MSLETFNAAAEKDRHHFIKCEGCGDMVDRRDLDEVAFHFILDHRAIPDIPYGGYRIKSPPTAD